MVAVGLPSHCGLLATRLAEYKESVDTAKQRQTVTLKRTMEVDELDLDFSDACRFVLVWLWVLVCFDVFFMCLEHLFSCHPSYPPSLLLTLPHSVVCFDLTQHAARSFAFCVLFSRVCRQYLSTLGSLNKRLPLLCVDLFIEKTRMATVNKEVASVEPKPIQASRIVVSTCFFIFFCCIRTSWQHA